MGPESGREPAQVGVLEQASAGARSKQEKAPGIDLSLTENYRRLMENWEK